MIDQHHGTSRGVLLWPIVLSVFLVVGGCAAGVLSMIEDGLRRERRAIVDLVTNDHAHLIGLHVEQALSATYPLAAMVTRGRGSVDGFQQLATEMLPYYPGASCLQLAPGGVVTHIVPLEGNEQAVGHELLVDRQRDYEAFLARDSGRLTLAGPFELVQGGIAAVGRLPIYIDQPGGGRTFWGFSTVLIRFPQVLDPARLSALGERGFAYELYRDGPAPGQKQFIARSSANVLDAPVRHTIDVPNTTWTLAVAPINGWGGSSIWFVTRCLVALLVSLLAGLIVRQAVGLREHKRDLERQVALRTADVEDQRRRMVQTLKNTSSGTWERDVLTGDIQFDEGWAAITGYTVGEVAAAQAKVWSQLIYPRHSPPADDERSQVEDTEGGYYETETRVEHKNGAWLWVLDRARVIERDAAGRPRRISGIRQDITVRKQAELDRARLEDDLRHAQKLEAVGTLASGVAHDFNNLLTAIYGNIEHLRREVPTNQAAQKSLDTLEQVAKQGSGVTSSLLTFAHKAPSLKRPVELSAVIGDFLRVLRRLLPASIEFDDRVSDGVSVWVNADATRLQQVLMNLAVNARDAIAGQGRLSFDLFMQPSPAAGSGGHADDRSGRAVIVVEDTGQGMDAATLERVFEPFFTTKSRGSGTGLGLAVVHGIVTDHGGDVQVRSEPGRGTRVEIALPTCAAPDEVAAETSGAPVPTVRAELILVAEDNPYVRQVVQDTLGAEGHRVLVAGDGEQAMAVFDTHADSLGLVVLDWDMPKASGESCMTRMKNRRDRLPIVVITGDPEIAAHLPSPHPGVRVLAKPFQMAALVQCVSRSLSADQT